MKNFRARETRTTPSNKSFQLAVAAESQSNQMQGSMSTTEWTDEKHSLYLKSMEASFVDQLYGSKEMLGWSSGRHTKVSDFNLLMNVLFNSTTTSGQFKVLCGGCWSKISYERNNRETNRANDHCEEIKSNPWIRPFRTSTKHRGLTSPAVEDRSTSTSQAADSGTRKGISSASEIIPKKFHFYESQISQQDMFCSDTENAEISDQNFVDEEVAEGEKENKPSSKKRMKSSITDASGNEQVVPIGKSSTTGDGGGGDPEN